MTLILIVPLESLAWVRNQAKTSGSSLIGLANGVGSFVTRYPVVDFAVCGISRTGNEGEFKLRCQPNGAEGATAIAGFNRVGDHDHADCELCSGDAILVGSPLAGMVVNSIGSSGLFGSPQSSGPLPAHIRIPFLPTAMPPMIGEGSSWVMTGSAYRAALPERRCGIARRDPCRNPSLKPPSLRSTCRRAPVA